MTTTPMPIVEDEGAAAFPNREARVNAPYGLIISLALLVAVLIGGYYLIGLDRMDASQITALGEPGPSPGA